MKSCPLPLLVCLLVAFTSLLTAQSQQAYTHAVTDNAIHLKTAMSPPPRNLPFKDPDFGSAIVRATDESTNYIFPGTSLTTDGTGKQNFWSADTKKFYVMGANGRDFAFGFDPSTMNISSLPNAKPGQGLLLPLGPGATFSFKDPDLIYGASKALVIATYRFSTNTTSTVIDTRTCGVQPPLGTGSGVQSDNDISLSLDDNRMSISEGGPEAGKNMFVVVYDKNLGCRWYNTQTGQVGGQWGATGLASVTTPYFINHAYLSHDGKYVLILVSGGINGWYIWHLGTLNLDACVIGSTRECGGYQVLGYDTIVNGPAILGDMQVAKRPLNNLDQITQLVRPVAYNWGLAQHFSWSNVNSTDTTPVCLTTYDYEADGTITQPYEGEIDCVETDGLQSTIWRFAHNRATYVEPYFSTQPLGTVSRDGRFYSFQANWDEQLGYLSSGEPRVDVRIVRLD
ncbi:MAG TPA: hypothetical protein VFO46_12955 [Candidatus Sulfotelmatobacter sp.]|nr:hypothetical protein [Candidatus Sulfotelmatobacter sp.]